MAADDSLTMDDLLSILREVRRGDYRIEHVDGLCAVARSKERPELEVLTALSLAAEITDQRGYWERAEEIIFEPGSRLLKEMLGDRSWSRGPAQEDAQKYKISRQKLWCVLAYCISLFRMHNVGQARQELQKLADCLDPSRNMLDKAEHGFRGVRARLHYYLGCTLRSLNEEDDRESFKHFDESVRLSGERLEKQLKRYPEDPERAATEYRYGNDSMARVLIFGQAWTFLAKGLLDRAESTLIYARALLSGTQNMSLAHTCKLLRLQVRRHKSQHVNELRVILAEVNRLEQESTRATSNGPTSDTLPHTVYQKRFALEKGLTLHLMLRRSAGKSGYKDERTMWCSELEKQIECLRREKAEEIALWLEALYRECEGRTRESLALTLRAEEKLRSFKQQSSAFWPLQYWHGQLPVLRARALVASGRREDSEQAIAGLEGEWLKAPEWLQALVCARRAAAYSQLEMIDQATYQLRQANRLCKRVQIKWVRDEAVWAGEFLDRAKGLQKALDVQTIRTYDEGCKRVLALLMVHEKKRQDKMYPQFLGEKEIVIAEAAKQLGRLDPKTLKKYLEESGSQYVPVRGPRMKK